MITLDRREHRVREILIRIAKGGGKTRRMGLISYKELWQRISQKRWGRGRKNDIVSVITRISAFELKHHRPPLNELVVVKGSHEPGEDWKSIKKHLEDEFGVVAKFSSHLEAQQECWRYWIRQSETSPQSDSEAEEGYQQDRTIKFRKRNAKIIADRKELDNFTCQACKLRLQVNGSFIVDCHHKNPLGHDAQVRITRLDELVCLCPTCHRVAHTRRAPLTVEEIRKARGR